MIRISFVWFCVWERECTMERDRKIEREKEVEWDRDRDIKCVCVRERERYKERKTGWHLIDSKNFKACNISSHATHYNIIHAQQKRYYSRGTLTRIMIRWLANIPTLYRKWLRSLQ